MGDRIHKIIELIKCILQGGMKLIKKANKQIRQ